MSNYAKEIEKQIENRVLSFEAWLRYVKKLSSKECFELKCAEGTLYLKRRKLQEEYDRWVGKESAENAEFRVEILDSERQIKKE